MVVTHFSGSDGRVRELHTQRVERLPHGTNRRLAGTEEVIPANLVLLAIGFSGPVRDRLLDDLQLQFDASGAIAADDAFRTSSEGVYVAGDAHRGCIAHRLGDRGGSEGRRRDRRGALCRDCHTNATRKRRLTGLQHTWVTYLLAGDSVAPRPRAIRRAACAGSSRKSPRSARSHGRQVAIHRAAAAPSDLHNSGTAPLPPLQPYMTFLQWVQDTYRVLHTDWNTAIYPIISYD